MLRSMPRLLALLPLLLILEGCPHPSTPSSNGRMDRPILPTLSPQILAPQRLAPIGHPETGVIVSVDKGWLDTVVQRFREAITAVNILNDHVAAVKLNQRCIKAVNETGKLPADCPAN